MTVSLSVPTRSRTAAFVALTKPRIIELLLVTTVPTMVVADQGIPSVWLMVATVVGGTLAAGGANAINMVIDRDIDALMERTRNRPLVTGELAPAEALTFAVGLEVVAFLWLWTFVNLLSAALAVTATLFYVFVYSLWLKRRSTQNIVIGGAAGAVPVLVGWAAVRNELGWAPWLLFGLMFLWTPPHFWALAIKYRDDYSAAQVPMLPSVMSIRETTTRIVAYTIPTVVLSLALAPAAELGAIYVVSATLLGAGFLYYAVRVHQVPDPRRAMTLFTFSITWVTLLFGAMVVDQIVRHGA